MRIVCQVILEALLKIGMRVNGMKNAFSLAVLLALAEVYAPHKRTIAPPVRTSTTKAVC